MAGWDWSDWPERRWALAGGLRRGWHDNWHDKETQAFSALVALLGAVAANSIVLSDDAGTWDRIGWSALAIALGYLAGFLLSLVGHIVTAPRRQRREARDRAASLEGELEDRDKIRCRVRVYTEELPPETYEPVNEAPYVHAYSERVLFWVDVRNLGPTAEFTAQLLKVDGLPNNSARQVVEHNGTVNEVAWENTLEPVNRIAFGGQARLKVALFAGRQAIGHDPDQPPPNPLSAAASPQTPVFFFYSAKSATWAAASHQVGWRYRPPTTVSRAITFDLIVTDVTHNASRRQSAVIEFGPSGTVPHFYPEGDLEVFRFGVDQ